jgi:hypothetical protein
MKGAVGVRRRTDEARRANFNRLAATMPISAVLAITPAAWVGLVRRRPQASAADREDAMPERLLATPYGAKSGQPTERVLDARSDRPDLRDRVYSPPLIALLPECPSADEIVDHIDDYARAGLVLDQGADGACTGFGLAAVINFLYYRAYALAKKGAAKKAKLAAPAKMSPHFLYRLAQIYDEWPGEDYSGSSCRGAMKGWFHHGVCADDFVRRDPDTGALAFKDDWAQDAAKRPIGAYYRVTRDSISDLQAAIMHVGAVYVSADAHEGWDVGGTRKVSSPQELPRIDWSPGAKAKGGHAFALVGYDESGFIVQNSWGTGWGYLGFARLSYQDWLANGRDAWVAVMGAKIAGRSPSFVVSSSKTTGDFGAQMGRGLMNGATADRAQTPPTERDKLLTQVWSLQSAMDCSLVLANHGAAAQLEVPFQTVEQIIDQVFYVRPKAYFDARRDGAAKTPPRLALYVHGGLNDLSAGLKRAQRLGPWFYANGIYPTFVLWRSGFLDALKDILSDKLLRADDLPAANAVGDKIFDVLDLGVEIAAAPLGGALWSKMKSNALEASGPKGGLTLALDALARLKRDLPELEMHLVGHSAGAVMLGGAFEAMRARKLRATTTTLFAPACTVGFALERYVPAAKNVKGAKVIDAGTTTIEVLSDEVEQADDVVGLYHKSLLYLVSRAFEPQKTPILGMEAVSWDNPDGDQKMIFNGRRGALNEDVKAWRETWKGPPPRVVKDKSVLTAKSPTGEEKWIKSAHGAFDNSIPSITRAINRMLGAPEDAELAFPITSLEGF